MKSLLKQIQTHRQALRLTQADVARQIRVSRQQYQAVESGGNPTLETLNLIADALHGQMVFVPKDKLPAVRALLEGKDETSATRQLKSKWLADYENLE